MRAALKFTIDKRVETVEEYGANNIEEYIRGEK